MKSQLETLMAMSARDLAGHLSRTAREDRRSALDYALIVARNVRRDGARMPLLVDFLCAELFRTDEKSAESVVFSALAVVGDCARPGTGRRVQAAEIFARSIREVARDSKARALEIAHATKALSGDGPVRSAAVLFLIESVDDSGLQDMARQADRLNEAEQMALLTAMDKRFVEKPGSLRLSLDDFINSVGVGDGAPVSKAYEMLDKCRKLPEFAVLKAGKRDVLYIRGDGSGINVPLDRTIQ